MYSLQRHNFPLYNDNYKTHRLSRGLLGAAVAGGVYYLRHNLKELKIPMPHKKTSYFRGLRFPQHSKRDPIGPRKGEQKQGIVESKDDLIQCPVHGGIVEHIRDDVNGNQIVSFHAKAHGGRSHMSNKGIVDRILFPKVIAKLRCYGTGLFGNSVAQGLAGPSFYNPTVGNGNTRSILTQAGKAVWVEFGHLLGGNEILKAPGTDGSSNQNICTGLSLKTLRAIARDSTNIPAQNTTYNNINGDDFGGTNVSKYFQTLNYNGGSTTHFFQNPGNVDVILEFFVCRPKHMLGFNHDPLSNWLVDLNSQYVGAIQTTQEQALGIGGTQATPSKSDNIDPIFTIRGAHHHIHHDWLVEKPKRVVLRGGGLIKFKIDHPAFSFIDTPFNLGIIGGQDSTNANQFVYIPGCSVFLVAKVIGQMVNNDTGSQVIVQLNNVSAQVAHWQQEYHNIRGSIIGQTDVEWNKDYITDTVTSPRLINPLTDANVAAQN